MTKTNVKEGQSQHGLHGLPSRSKVALRSTRIPSSDACRKCLNVFAQVEIMTITSAVLKAARDARVTREQMSSIPMKDMQNASYSWETTGIRGNQVQ